MNNKKTPKRVPAHDLEMLRQLAASGARLYAVSETGWGLKRSCFIYTDRAAARREIKKLEAYNKEMGWYKPKNYEIIECTKQYL